MQIHIQLKLRQETAYVQMALSGLPVVQSSASCLSYE